MDQLEFISVRQSEIHGNGVFAKKKIAKGTRLIEYVGQQISKAESAKRCEAENPFIFSINDEIDLDGDVGWNPAKFINHSCSANCEAEQDGERIWIIALRKIEAGEEISFNYGYDLESYKEHPCGCGSLECVGYIVAKEYFPKFKTLTV